VDPRAGLDDVEKRKFMAHRDSNSETSLVQQVAIPTELYEYFSEPYNENLIYSFHKKLQNINGPE
jgi:hypothetical protein